MNPRTAFEEVLLAERVAVRIAKSKTFAEAKAELLAYLEKEGWKLSSKTLKIPYATSPDGTIRLWFKAQAIYYTQGTDHNMGAARSIHSEDIRKMSPEHFMKQVERWFE